VQGLGQAIIDLKKGAAGAQVLSDKIAQMGTGDFFTRGASVEMTIEASQQALEITKNALMAAGTDVQSLPDGDLKNKVTQMIQGSLGMWQKLGQQALDVLQTVPNDGTPENTGDLQQAQQGAAMVVGNAGRLCEGTAEAIEAFATGTPLSSQQ
jgi:hypothetical protein